MHPFHFTSTACSFARQAIAVIGITLLAQTALAQAVVVQNAWARATVPGQTATGVFMSLSSPAGARLVWASAPVAGVAEVHEMRLEGDVMKMATLKDGLELPAGKTVELKPGSYHLMLMDLKAPLEVGTIVALTLLFTNAAGQPNKLELQLPVSNFVPGASAVMDHSQHKS